MRTVMTLLGTLVFSSVLTACLIEVASSQNTPGDNTDGGVSETGPNSSPIGEGQPAYMTGSDHA